MKSVSDDKSQISKSSVGQFPAEMLEPRINAVNGGRVNTKDRAIRPNSKQHKATVGPKLWKQLRQLECARNRSLKGNRFILRRNQGGKAPYIKNGHSCFSSPPYSACATTSEGGSRIQG